MTPTRAKYLSLRDEYFQLMEKSIRVGAQLPDPATLDLIDDDDPSWDRIHLLLKEFHRLQQAMASIVVRAQKLQQLN